MLFSNNVWGFIKTLIKGIPEVNVRNSNIPFIFIKNKANNNYFFLFFLINPQIVNS